MKNFTIADLERFSGIRAHTLRIWERRYPVLRPMRSVSNIRYYSVIELKTILHLALLNKSGCRISTLCNISPSEIEKKIQALPDGHFQWQKAVIDLTVSMYAEDPCTIEKVLDDLFFRWPAKIFVENIIYPFLNNTALLWIGNKVFEEHIVVTAIRQKMLHAIDAVRTPAGEPATVLLFLPDTRQLDLGLLYSHFILKSKGFKVLYLGNDITPLNLQNALEFQSFTYIFTYLRHPTQAIISSMLSTISSHSPDSILVIGKYDDPLIGNVYAKNLRQLNFHEALLSM